MTSPPLLSAGRTPEHVDAALRPKTLDAALAELGESATLDALVRLSLKKAAK